MRIKKVLRSLIIIFLIIVTLLLILSNSKYLWKVFGFAFCENPQTITIYSIRKDYTLGYINIKGTIKDIDKYYSGYIIDIKDNKVYVGLKYNSFFGYDKKTKDFNIQIPCDINRVYNIYLVNSLSEVKIK